MRLGKHLLGGLSRQLSCSSKSFERVSFTHTFLLRSSQPLVLSVSSTSIIVSDEVLL